MSASNTPSKAQISPYAKRLPKPRNTKSGEAHDQDAQDVQHYALQKIISMLQDSPHLILETCGRLEKRLDNSPSKSEGECFAADTSHLNKIPTIWRAAWIQSLVAGALKDELLKQMLSEDSDCVERMVTMALQLPKTTILPSECLVKQIAARLFSQRCLEVGNLISRVWVQKNVNSAGVVDWSNGGCRMGNACA